jgi:hypothetical protein
MHKNATKCNKTQSKWCVNKHGASKIIDTFETYHPTSCLVSYSQHMVATRLLELYGLEVEEDELDLPSLRV